MKTITLAMAALFACCLAGCHDPSDEGTGVNPNFSKPPKEVLDKMTPEQRAQVENAQKLGEEMRKKNSEFFQKHPGGK